MKSFMRTFLTQLLITVAIMAATAILVAPFLALYHAWQGPWGAVVGIAWVCLSLAALRTAAEVWFG